MRKLRKQPGRHPHLDFEAEKRAGWREHGILVVAEEHRRLTWSEQEMVRQLGARLCGQRGVAADD